MTALAAFVVLFVVYAATWAVLVAWLVRADRNRKRARYEDGHDGRADPWGFV